MHGNNMNGPHQKSLYNTMLGTISSYRRSCAVVMKRRCHTYLQIPIIVCMRRWQGSGLPSMSTADLICTRCMGGRTSVVAGGVIEISPSASMLQGTSRRSIAAVYGVSIWCSAAPASFSIEQRRKVCSVLFYMRTKCTTICKWKTRPG